MSPVVKQMTSNMVVAKRDVVQMCFVWFRSLAALAGYVALVTAFSNDELRHPNKAKYLAFLRCVRLL